MKEMCNNFTQDDTASLLCQLNQAKRKGIKVPSWYLPNIESVHLIRFQVNPLLRCVACCRPISKLPGTLIGGTAGSKGANNRHVCPESTVLGTPSIGNGIVVFSAKTIYHRQCFDKEMSAVFDASST